MRDLIIGIDGGGTKTNYMALDIRTGDIVSTSSSGSIHVFTMGEDTALQNLESGFCGLHLNDEDRVIAISIINSGSTAKALAIPILCLCPPENSCTYRSL